MVYAEKTYFGYAFRIRATKIIVHVSLCITATDITRFWVLKRHQYLFATFIFATIKLSKLINIPLSHYSILDKRD